MIYRPSPYWRNQPSQRLPRVVPPFRNETTFSFMRRLAHANHLDTKDLHYYVAGRVNGRINTAWLSLATGYPEADLIARLPDLTGPPLQHRHPRGRVGAICRYCAARRRVFEHIRIYLDINANVCMKHRIWIGGASRESQLDVSPLPELVTAQRRHDQLIRRRGHEAAEAAFLDAVSITDRWTTRFAWRRHREQRLRVLFPSYFGRIMLNSTEVDIANYPDAVNLAGLLASPHWVAKAVSIQRRYADIISFYAEAGRRLGVTFDIDGRGLDSGDPLVGWVNRKQDELERAHYLATKPAPGTAKPLPTNEPTPA